MGTVFGDGYELDVDAFELRHHGEPVAVEPQVFDVLAYLVERRDRVVTKEEMLDNIWGDRFASLRLCLADPFSYMLGVRYGGRVRDRIERSRLRRLLVKATNMEKSACMVAVWLRPSQTVLAWAGSLRLAPKYVAVADVVTTVAYVILIHRGMSLF